MKIGETEISIFWLVMTAIMLLGFLMIDELPLKLFKIIVFAGLVIYTMQRIFGEPKEWFK